MEMKFKIVIMIIVAIIVFNIIFRLLGFSQIAKKKGIKTEGRVVGYYSHYDFKNMFYYPIIRVNNVIVQPKCLLLFPVYKINESVKVQYYSDGMPYIVNKSVYTNKLSTNKEELRIDENAKINILDYKHNIDIFIEILIVIILLIIV